MDNVCISTFDAITSLVGRFGSQSAAAKFLGVSSATISDILRGRVSHISRERENQIRVSLALPPLPALVTIPSCPDCGNVHHGRCHNKNVILRPVRPRCEPQRIREYTVSQLAQAIRYRSEI